MALKRKNTGRAMSLPAGIALGIGISLAVSILGAMVLAWLIVSERAGESAIGYGCVVIIPMASLVGCICAWKFIRHQRLMITGITAAGFYLALLALALLFGGKFEGMGVAAILVLLGGGIALIPALLGNKSGARRHKIPVYR